MATETLGPTRHDLPREGYSLFFNAENHAYQRVNPKGLPGTRYPGASTIGKAFPDRPDPLMFWTETMTLEGVSRLSKAQVSIPEDPFILRATLEKHELRWQQLRDKAAKRGTNIHVQVLEALAQGQLDPAGEVPDLADLPEDERGYGQAVFKWWQARKPKPLQVEQVVLSLEHGFAGRFDLRCEIDSPLNPCHGVGIVDLKTSKRPYRSDHVQLAGYSLAARECGIGDVDWLMILQVKEDGTPIEHYCAATEDDFMLALNSYKAAARVDKAMAA